MLLRRSAAFLAVGAILLTGCSSGSDIPTKAEWIKSVRDRMGSDLSSLEGSGIDSAKANKIIDDFLGCTYDKIKDDTQLLEKAASSGSSSIDSQISKKAASCQSDMITAMSAAAKAAIGSTTTTAKPADG